MRVAQTAVVYFLSKLFAAVIGFIGMIYIARVLGSEVIGYYSLSLSIVSWLGLIITVGLKKSIIKRVSEGEHKGEYITAGLIIMVFFGIVICWVVYSVRNYVNSYVGTNVHIYIILLILVLIVTTIVTVSLKGNHLVHIYSILSATKKTFRRGFQIIFVSIGSGIAGLLLGYAIGGLIFAVVGVLILNIELKHPEKAHYRSLFDYGRYAWVGDIRSRSFSDLDIIILGFFVSPSLVGIYSIAWTISKFLDTFGTGIKTTLFPKMSKFSSNNDIDSVRNLTENAILYSGILLIPSLIGSLLIGDYILYLYGSEFTRGEIVLPILIGSLLVYTYNMQLLNTLNAIDRPDLSFRANGVFILSNLLLNLSLVFLFGWVGAAVATLLSASLGIIISFYYVQSLVGITIPVMEIVRQWISALVMGCILYISIDRLSTLIGNRTFEAIGFTVVGATIYLSLYIVLSARFRKTIKMNMPYV